MTRRSTDPIGTLWRRYRWWTAGLLAVLAVAGIVIALWPSPPAARALPPTRARQYLAFDACLLTPTAGLADQSVAPVWAGMQDASLATRAKVSYLSVAGPQTVSNAVPYANTLLARQCNVVIAVGQSQVDAVNKTAPDHPHARFVVVGGKPAAGNVTEVAGGPATSVRASVDAIVTNLAH